MSHYYRRIRRQRSAAKHQEGAEVHAMEAPVARSKAPIVPKSKHRSPLSSKNHSYAPKPLIGPNARAQALASARARLDLALKHGHAPQTSTNYGYAIKRYLKFTESIGFSEAESLPASEELVLLFACEGLGRTGPGTAKQNLSALRLWHIKRRLPWKRPECLGLIAKALTEMWPRSAKKRETRPPVKLSMIKMLADAWKDGSPCQRCAFAIAVTAWCGQCRLGELLPPSQASFDKKRIPKRSAWSAPSLDGASSQIKLPWTKTTLFEGATVFLLKQRSPLNATEAVASHFESSRLSSSRFLCEFRERGQTRFLCKEIFMDMCNEVWSSKGLPRITGHSFRIGGTTTLLCSGVNPEIVKKMGRWSSDAFLLYWRSLDRLFTKHAADLLWKD